MKWTNNGLIYAQPIKIYIRKYILSNNSGGDGERYLGEDSINRLIVGNASIEEEEMKIS